MDGQLDRRTDRQTDGQTDETDYIGAMPRSRKINDIKKMSMKKGKILRNAEI